MFINRPTGSITNRTMPSLGPDRTFPNDENKSAFCNRNNVKSSVYSYPSKRSNVGGLTNRTHPKTPSNSENTRRRALGDISNRKATTNDKKQIRETFSQTPHKPRVVSSHTNTRKNNSIKQKLGKTVTFECQSERSSKIPIKQKQRRKQRAISSSTKVKRKEGKNESRRHNIDNVELPAGRGWVEEQLLIGDDDLSLASLDCQKTLDDYKAIEILEVEAFRKDRQQFVEKYEKQYQEKMKNFTEMTRFEGLNGDGIGSLYITKLEDDLIHFDLDRIDGGYDCFSDHSDGDSVSL